MVEVGTLAMDRRTPSELEELMKKNNNGVLEPLISPATSAQYTSSIEGPRRRGESRRYDDEGLFERQEAEEGEGEISRNVAYIYAYTFFIFAGRSIWSRSVLSAYVYILKNESPEAVGYITAVMGFTQLLASFPTGYMADKYRRDTMLKMASFVGVIATIVTLLSLYNLSWKFLVVALSIWGVVWGIANTSMTALFADSVRDEQRTKYFTNRSMVLKLGTTTGPCVALLMFYLLGDEWNVKDCAIVMAIGQAVGFPALILLFFVNDDYATGAIPANTINDNDVIRNAVTSTPNHTDFDISIEINATTRAHNNTDYGTNRTIEEEETSASTENVNRAVQSNGINCNMETNEMNHDFIITSGHRSEQTTHDDSSIISEDRNVCNNTCSKYYMYFIPKNRIIPSLIVCADIVSGLSSGVSIRYFSIFFMHNLHLSPVMVQVLFAIGPVCQAALMKLAQNRSKTYGRCYITILHRWIGILCMVLMIICYVSTTNNILKFPTWIICAFYLLRVGFMNSTNPLTKSMLMDNVPAKERGKWSALESVNMFSWSGSAAIGGILVAEKGIVFNFCITSGMQLLSTIPIIIILKFFADDCEKSQNREIVVADHSNRINHETDVLEQQLSSQEGLNLNGKDSETKDSLSSGLPTLPLSSPLSSSSSTTSSLQSFSSA